MGCLRQIFGIFLIFIGIIMEFTANVAGAGIQILIPKTFVFIGILLLFWKRKK